MKKIILMLLIVSSVYAGGVVACKNKDSLMLIAQASDRAGMAQLMERSGECIASYDYVVKDYDGLYVKIFASDGGYYWTLRSMMK